MKRILIILFVISFFSSSLYSQKAKLLSPYFINENAIKFLNNLVLFTPKVTNKLHLNCVPRFYDYKNNEFAEVGNAELGIYQKISSNSKTNAYYLLDSSEVITINMDLKINKVSNYNTEQFGEPIYFFNENMLISKKDRSFRRVDITTNTLDSKMIPDSSTVIKSNDDQIYFINENLKVDIYNNSLNKISSISLNEKLEDTEDVEYAKMFENHLIVRYSTFLIIINTSQNEIINSTRLHPEVPKYFTYEDEIIQFYGFNERGKFLLYTIDESNKIKLQKFDFNGFEGAYLRSAYPIMFDDEILISHFNNGTFLFDKKSYNFKQIDHIPEIKYGLNKLLPNNQNNTHFVAEDHTIFTLDDNDWLFATTNKGLTWKSVLSNKTEIKHQVDHAGIIDKNNFIVKTPYSTGVTSDGGLNYRIKYFSYHNLLNNFLKYHFEHFVIPQSIRDTLFIYYYNKDYEISNKLKINDDINSAESYFISDESLWLIYQQHISENNNWEKYLIKLDSNLSTYKKVKITNSTRIIDSDVLNNNPILLIEQEGKYYLSVLNLETEKIELFKELPENETKAFRSLYVDKIEKDIYITTYQQGIQYSTDYVLRNGSDTWKKFDFPYGIWFTKSQPDFPLLRFGGYQVRNTYGDCIFTIIKN